MVDLLEHFVLSLVHECLIEPLALLLDLFLCDHLCLEFFNRDSHTVSSMHADRVVMLLKFDLSARAWNLLRKLERLLSMV